MQCSSGSAAPSFSAPRPEPGTSDAGSPTHSPTGGADGGGIRIVPGGGGGTSSGDAGTLPTSITATIRDFRFYNPNDPSSNPDFENAPFDIDESGHASPGYQGPWDDPAIIGPVLGADGTPVYVGDPHTGTLTTHGTGTPTGAVDSFHAWFHDVPGTNIAVSWPVPLVTQANGSVQYDSAAQGAPYGNTPKGSPPGNGFFPIDDGTPYATSFGNEGWPNNYAFTCEIHTVFTYRGGEYFNFRGDDDVYVFINKQRVINLGGVHGPESANVQVDSLGLTPGAEYSLDFFSAERHVTGSNILFETTLGLKPAPPQ